MGFFLHSYLTNKTLQLTANSEKNCSLLDMWRLLLSTEQYKAQQFIYCLLGRQRDAIVRQNLTSVVPSLF